MRWSGTTREQREALERGGIQCFAYLPTQMCDGTWIWLEHYWAVRRINYLWRPQFNHGPDPYVRHTCLSVAKHRADRRTRPPPPSPTRPGVAAPRGATPPPKR